MITNKLKPVDVVINYCNYKYLDICCDVINNVLQTYGYTITDSFNSIQTILVYAVTDGTNLNVNFNIYRNDNHEFLSNFTISKAINYDRETN